MMEHIRPTQSQKNRMLENAITPKTVRKSFKMRYCVLAVAAAMLIPTTVFAGEIKSAIYSIFTKNEIVSEDVLSEIYTDSDGHITMTVKELLSDKIHAYAVVEYIAHDEKGRKWLEKYEPLGSISHTFSLYLSPDWDENNEEFPGVNFSYFCREFMEYKTEDKRVFALITSASQDDFGSSSLKLNYDMVNRDLETSIDVSNSVEIRNVKIDSSLAPDKSYKPTGFKFSSLGIMIYGENCGNYETGRTSTGGQYRKSLSDDSVESLYLVMKDGTKKDLLNIERPDSENLFLSGSYSTLGAVSTLYADYDLSIYSSTFAEITDIDTIAGIELDGVYYSVEQ